MPEITNKSEEQKVAEAKVEGFRKDLGPFVVAAETTRMAMVFTDAKEQAHPIIFANDAFLSLTGYDREEVLGHSFNFLMARGADPKALAQVEAAFVSGDDVGSEIRYRRKDGSVFWAALFISPVRDESGEVVQHFASFVDLTRHKQEQAKSHDDDRRAESSRKKYPCNGSIHCLAGFAKRFRSQGDPRIHRVSPVCPLPVARSIDP
jgi:PAS domain S-box-containing protein